MTSAEYLDGHRVRLAFSNGDSGVVDLQGELWGPVFEPLKDVEVFRHFTLSGEMGTICWENEADFAPEFLHARMLEQAAAAGAAGR